MAERPVADGWKVSALPWSREAGPRFATEVRFRQ